MISQNDLSAYFKLLPRNFELIINGIAYKCNKLCLMSFSAEISDFIKSNTDSTKYEAIIEASDDHIKNIIDFLHGELFNPREDEYFDYYFIAASLGIEVIRKRIHMNITKVITSDNVTAYYEKLSKYPDFCDPLIRFFDANPSFFRNFVKENVFHSVLIHSLFKNVINMFETEDSKLEFIQTLNSDPKSTDLSLYQYIYPEKLSNEHLNNFLQLPYEVSVYTHCFKLISKLLHKKNELNESLNSIKSKTSQIQSDLTFELNIKNSQQQEISQKSNQISNAVQTEEQVRIRAIQLANKLEFLAADVALLSVQNEPTQIFLKNVGEMRKLCVDMHALMKYFYEQGGWLLWPGSSVNSMNYSKELDEAMEQLQIMVDGFEPNSELLCMFSQYFVKICDNIRKAANT
ncbi:hypothetical protein TRFO_00856 [Tritrichomonas foetus]|uniref:BTB domain-containing protein n=1 Tax=Tritrichomonas foetus TaxID=1144522 RepID=A0A1J4L258_9EUKA|nr:hypothetical protein TRFO_00856 [Tritrichomonas foetus]|eukprot:OHT17599.1 hypothetical protein TRFO_00856 [Tritrichomonas foetus]